MATAAVCIQSTRAYVPPFSHLLIFSTTKCLETLLSARACSDTVNFQIPGVVLPETCHVHCTYPSASAAASPRCLALLAPLLYITFNETTAFGAVFTRTAAFLPGLSGSGWIAIICKECGLDLYSHAQMMQVKHR